MFIDCATWHCVAGTYIIGTSFYFDFILFSVFSIGFALASTRICIIYWVKLKIKQEISISSVFKDKNFQPVSHAAMLGCRYPIVPTSALHQWYNSFMQLTGRLISMIMIYTRSLLSAKWCLTSCCLHHWNNVSKMLEQCTYTGSIPDRLWEHHAKHHTKHLRHM